MKNVWWYVLGALVITFAFGAWWFMGQGPAPTPYPLELAAGDTVTSWSFQGAYTGKPELIARANTEIARLKKLRGTKEATDYEIYVSIANQYDLMGDGENELLYLTYALGIDADMTGLAWHNAAVLFERLGAFSTARMAYEKAAQVQGIPQYVDAFKAFVKAHPSAQ